MLKTNSIFGRLLDRIQSRFNRSRPGSVMILVVTLLVLMALIGTAYISTARTDRAVARMHTANVQIDMFKQGVQQMVFGSLAHNTFLNNGGQLWDDALIDPWMASRIPMRVSEACGLWRATTGYYPGQWVQQAGSYYICVNPSGMTGGFSPDVDTLGNWYNVSVKGPANGFTVNDATVCWPAVSTPLIPGLQPLDITSLTPYTPTRYLVCPDFILVGATKLPALWVYDFNYGHMIKVLAGNASGDGIADSLMWPLHSGEVNGIEYFASYRVIDGNSAINLNTAGSTFFDYLGDGTAETIGGAFINDAIFPGNIGLSELFPMADMTGLPDSSQGQEFLSLNLYRHSSIPRTPTAVTAALYKQWPSAGVFGATTSTPWGDYGQRSSGAHRRPDIVYRTEADAQFMNLGRRIDYPGPASELNNAVGYAGSFGWNDAAALAYQFDLPNPNTFASNNLSLAENLLPESLLGIPSVAGERVSVYSKFAPDQVGNGTYGNGWFGANYAYEDGSNSYLDPQPNNRPVYNRRAIVTSHNPTSNQMPLSRALYEPGNGVGALEQLSNLAHARPSQAFDQMGVPYGLPVPWPNPLVNQIRSELPPPIPKVNLNTASVTANDFNQNNSVSNGAFIPFQGPSLWFGFYNVMADASLRLYNRPANLAAAPPDPGAFPEQFRSALRDPTTPYTATTSTLNQITLPARTLNLGGMVMIRSLIAAANAQAMRDSDDDVKSQTITLRVADVMGPGTIIPSDNGTLQVTVYPVERQPFITEVYVNNDTSIPLGQIPDPTKPIDVSDPMNPQPALRPNLNTQANPQGYVAVELYNPYDIPINIGGWTLGILNRDPAAAVNPYPTMHVQPIPDAANKPWFFPPNTIIPARGFLTLDNMEPMTPPPTTPVVGSATYRPYEAYAGLSDTLGASASVAPALGILFVPNLQKVLKDPANPGTQPGGELMLLRPRHANGVPNAGYNEIITDPADSSKTVLNPEAMDPVDSFDFTGMTLPPSATLGPFQAWHYTRANSNSADTLGLVNPPRSSWRMVFPGRWDATRAIREDGVTASTPWNGQMDPTNPMKPVYPPTIPSTFDPWIMTPPGGTSTGPATTQPSTQPATQPFDNNPSAPIALGQPDYSSTAVSNDFLPIQLNNTGFNPLGPAGTPHGMNKNFLIGGAPVPGQFPFGGFARVGDVLQVPFIGSYTISVPYRPDPKGYYILEMNSVTRDAALADALSPLPNEHNIESIGKLCPLLAANGGPLPFNDGYGWASHVLDCFTAIHSPHMQYFPHVDPNPVDPNAWFISPGGFYFNNRSWDPVVGSYLDPNAPGGAIPPPELVSNSSTGLAPGVEGLININTAPWRVLAAVPWKANDGTLAPADLALYNEAVAKSIVAYRNENGPFKSLFDLNLMRVQFGFAPFTPARTDSLSFQLLNGPIGGATDYDAHMGDFTPSFPITQLTTDGVKGDAKERFATITRISNLVTIRSDTFTVYIQVQGWRGIATGNPELIVQRRLAFIVDRSGYPAPGYPKVMTTIPTD